MTTDAGAWEAVAARDAVARLRRFGGEELARDMAALFAELAPQHLALARAAAASGDHDALARAAHALRGSCGQMGAAAAAQLCREAELAGPTAPVPELLRLVARIEREVATHQAWLARELAAGAALP